MKKRLLLTVFCLAGLAVTVCGQSVALKTNLLYGAGTFTPNLAIEAGLGDRTTLALSGGYNPWNWRGSYEDNRKLVHMTLQPEFRWWTCERFNGHFFGVHGIYAQYNIGGYDIPLLFEKEYRYDGFAFGGGLSYGYHLMLSRRWGLEFTIGAGVVYMPYEKYNCDKCSDMLLKDSKTYFGPTKAGITLVFIIK